MRVAFVTPRYGRHVVGGAESAARQLAEHLVASTGWHVEVFTSTALGSREDAERWVDLNGPLTPRLVDALCAGSVDFAISYPYL